MLSSGWTVKSGRQAGGVMGRGTVAASQANSFAIVTALSDRQSTRTRTSTAVSVL